MTVALDVQVPPFDFAKALRDIVAGGMTRAEIARALNVPRGTLEEWLTGAHPRWHHGTAILLLHAQRKQLAESRNT